MKTSNFKNLVDAVIESAGAEGDMCQGVVSDYKKVHEHVGQLLGAGNQLINSLVAIRSELVRRQAAYDTNGEPYVGFTTAIIECCRSVDFLREPSEAEWIEAISVVWRNRHHLHAMAKGYLGIEQLYAKDYSIGRGVRYLVGLGINASFDGKEVSFLGDANAILTQKFDALAQAGACQKFSVRPGS